MIKILSLYSQHGGCIAPIPSTNVTAALHFPRRPHQIAGSYRASQRGLCATHRLPLRSKLFTMPVRVVHHSMVVRALNNRATASWGRVRSAFKPPPPARFPIPLILPCEILLIIAEMLPPEACACLVNCCSYMRGLYCEDGTFATEQLWAALLRRTFPQRYTGAPGPNAPPRLRGSARLALGVFARDWVGYRRMLRAVSTCPPPPVSSTPLPHPFHAPSTHPRYALSCTAGAVHDGGADRQVCAVGLFSTLLVQAHAA